ncbi:MAG TPA: dihydrouridine synthase, partial [Azonexus sp.]|nr:dihydrouridine synthase [Azonexus sp.]
TVATYWLGVRKKVVPVHAGGRLKQWLAMMRRNYPEAEVLYDRMRPIKAAADIDAAMIDEGLVTREQLAA